MTDATATATKPAKPAADVETVKMEDGRLVEFPGKKRMLKDSFITDNVVTIRLDFRNGRTLTHTIRPDMLPKYAAHGGEQKLGDEIAGLKKEDGSEADIDDLVLVEEQLIERLENGEWTATRAGDGMSGTSVLLQAIVTVTGKARDAVKTFLAGKTPKEKAALRDSAKFREAVAQIEAERAAKRPKIDVSAIEAEIEAIPD